MMRTSKRFLLLLAFVLLIVSCFAPTVLADSRGLDLSNENLFLEVGAVDQIEVSSSRDADYIGIDMETREISYYNVDEPQISAFISNRVLTKPAYIPDGLDFDVPDTREVVADTTMYPYAATCLMYVRFAGSSYFFRSGTAWLIDGKTAVTAGHCIYDIGNNENPAKGFPVEVYIVPGYSDGVYDPYVPITSTGAPDINTNSAPYGMAKATALHTNLDWTNYGNPYYDWGVIELDTNFAEVTGYYGYHYLGDSPILVGENITVAGYPVDNNDNYQRVATGTINKQSHDGIGGALYYDIYTWGGSSGSPAYTTSSSGATALGINAYSIGIDQSGMAVKMSIEMYFFFNSFVY